MYKKLGGFVLRWNGPDAHLAAHGDTGDYFMWLYESHMHGVCMRMTAVCVCVNTTGGFVDSRRLMIGNSVL